MLQQRVGISVTRLFIVILITSVAFLPLAIGDPASPITVNNTASPSPVPSGQEITYTITVVNTAGSKITNVLMSDQLNGVGGVGVPPQLQITSTRGSCTQSTTLVTCNAGTIEGGGSWFVSIRGVVTAAAGTSINNTASVSGTHTAQNFTTTATTSTLVTSGGGGSPLPDLTISKNGPTSVQTSSAMTYTLTVNNIGNANATNVKVVDTVPAGLTGITASGTSLFTCGVSGQTVTCTGGAVNFGSNATITINATSPSTTGTITNTASVDPDDTIPESNELNNTSALVNTQVTAVPPPSQLTISVTDNPDPVIPGAVLTYTILVTNSTTQRADDVVVTLGTQGLVASSIQVNQVITNGTVGNTGGCTIAAPQAQCSDRTLNAGGTILMTVSGSVIASAGSTLIGTGTVTGNINHIGVSTTATQLTTVKPGVDLTVTIADSPDPVCARSWPGASPAPLVCRGGLTYTFVVGNSGIQTATPVELRDPLPPDTKLENFTAPAGFACSVLAGNIFDCTGGSVPPQSTVTFTINLLAPATTGSITNTVTVDPNNAIFEGDETNNTATQTTQVITGIDLTVAKTDAIDPIATSGTETYTITVNNLGTQDATNIRVRDTLPANTIFRDVNSDHLFTCSYASGTVECIGGAIKGTASNNDPTAGGVLANPPDTATIVVRVFAQPFAGIMHNIARVDPNLEIAEADETNNTATQDTVVDSFVSGHGSFNQLTITKTQTSPDKTNTARNAKVTWLIDVGNNGTDTAVGVTVRDFLPAGARYIEATGTNKFNCSQVSNYINCVGGEIASLAHATITLTAFAPDTPGTYVNQAIVDPDNTIPEGDELDNQAFETTIVKNGGAGPFYDLTILKTQTSPDKNNTARNSVVTYNLHVTNNGSDPVIGVKVRDTLPPAFRYISATGTNQFVCAQAAGVVDCVGGQISGGGGTADITVTAFAPDTVGSYVNQALVDPDNTIPEGDELNNQSQETTVVKNTSVGAFNDLTINKTATPLVAPGGPIQNILTINNLGSDPAVNVTVRDVLPAGEVFVSAADAVPNGPGAFTCSASNNVVNCIGATINPGVPRTIAIIANAPQQNTTLLNTAVVDPDNTIPEGNEENNTWSAPTTVSSPIDLQITKDGPTTASQSDVTDYTITVTNFKADGTGANAIGVVMVDPLPVGLIPLATDLGSGNNWACTIDQNPINKVTCLGDLGPGDKVTIKITVFVTAEDGRSLDNVACVDPDNLIVESNELNNCSDHGTFVAPKPKTSPDLFVSKSVDKTSTTPGDTLTYNINISNNGTAKALSPLTLTDPLPSQVTFTNVTATNSWTCSQAAGTVTCHDGGSGLDVGQSAMITILVKVNDHATGTISNTATADPAVGDCPDPTTCENETVAHLPNTSTVTSSLGGSGFDLFVGAITDSPDPAAPGAGLKYTIAAGNAGTELASNVHMEVDLPSAGVTFVGASGSNGWTCGGPTLNKLDCHGDLPGGGTTTIIVSFTTLLSAPPPTSVSLTATIDPAGAFMETNEGNNTLTQVTTISGTACTSCIDLIAAQLVANPDPANSGDTVHITFDIVNTGDEPTALDPAHDHLLSLNVVSDGSFAMATPTSSNPAVVCTTDSFGFFLFQFEMTSCKGNLGPGQGVTIKLDVPNVTGSELLLTGNADPDGKVTESNEGNNQLNNSVVINP